MMLLCSNHWIAIMIMPKIGRAVVLDSADYDRKRYREFIGILKSKIFLDIPIPCIFSLSIIYAFLNYLINYYYMSF